MAGAACECMWRKERLSSQIAWGQSPITLNISADAPSNQANSGLRWLATR